MHNQSVHSLNIIKKTTILQDVKIVVLELSSATSYKATKIDLKSFLTGEIRIITTFTAKSPIKPLFFKLL